MRGRAVIVGGGLAGIASALRLSETGWDVTLLESRPRLGGATYSFDRDGLHVDTGQHVSLRCYTAYRDLLTRLGVADLAPLQDRLDVPVLLGEGRHTRLRRTRWGPAPLHLAPTLTTYSAVPVRERVSVMRAAAALARVDPDDLDHDAHTFGDWLRSHGQRPRAIDALWRLLTVAALNLEPDEASLALAARVFRTGLLEDARAGDIAVSRVPLSDLHDTPARRLFDRVGVRVRTGERVRAVDTRGTGFVVRTDAQETDAEAVVVAVPHRVAAALVPEDAAAERGRWHQLGASPIVNVHVRYDRPVLRWPFAAAVDADLQWVFDRTAAGGSTEGQYLVSSVSAADASVATPAARLRDTHLEAIARLLPASRRARVLDTFVTREPRATFRQRSGTAPLRPPPTTRWPGLVLAGAWTGTGWPDTMEGAVRSGHAAADVLNGSTRDVRAHKEMIA